MALRCSPAQGKARSSPSAPAPKSLAELFTEPSAATRVAPTASNSSSKIRSQASARSGRMISLPSSTYHQSTAPAPEWQYDGSIDPPAAKRSLVRRQTSASTAELLKLPSGSPCSAPRSSDRHSPEGSRTRTGSLVHQCSHRCRPGTAAAASRRTAGHSKWQKQFTRSRSIATHCPWAPDLSSLSASRCTCTRLSQAPGTETPTCRRNSKPLRMAEACRAQLCLATRRRSTSPIRTGRGAGPFFLRRYTSWLSRIQWAVGCKPPSTAAMVKAASARTKRWPARCRRTPAISLRCSGRLPLGPAALSGLKRIFRSSSPTASTLLAAARGASSASGSAPAASARARARSGQRLVGSSCSAHWRCSSDDMSAVSVTVEAVAFE